VRTNVAGTAGNENSHGSNNSQSKGLWRFLANLKGVIESRPCVACMYRITSV
jgi:hypothetical protein